MSWVDSRTAQEVKGGAVPAGAARLKRRRRSSACVPVIGSFTDEPPEDGQLLSGKEMFAVIKRLSREKAVTMQLARKEIETAFENGYASPRAEASPRPSKMSSLRKAGQRSMKLPSRLRSPVSSSTSRLVPKGDKSTGDGAVIHELVKRQESGAPILKVTPPLGDATVRRQRSSSVDHLSTRIRSSESNSALLQEVQDLANSKGNNTLFSNLTSKFKRKKQKKKISSSMVEHSSADSHTASLPPPNLPPPNLPPPNLPPPNLPPPNLPPPNLPPPNLPPPVLEETKSEATVGANFPSPKFTPRERLVKRFPTPKFSPMPRNATLPDIGPPPSEESGSGVVFEEEDFEEEPDGELASYAVRARNSRRCSGIPRMEKLSIADRAQNLSKKNLKEVNAVQVDEMARFADMRTEDFVSLVIMGLNTLTTIAQSCLDGEETLSELPPDVKRENTGEHETYDGVSRPLKSLILRLYRFIRFILNHVISESMEHLDCAKDLVCVLKNTDVSDLSGAVEEKFFEAIRAERSAVTAMVCNQLKEDAHETLLQLLTNGVYLCSLFTIKNNDNKKAAKDDAYGMAALLSARSVIDLVGDLVDKIAAVTVFSAMQALQREKEEGLAQLGQGPAFEPDNINVYDEMIHDHTGSGLASDGSEGELCRCHLPDNAETVNSIVCTITDPTGEHTLEYVKMIITTHSAFTTHWNLFLKLRERFHAPESVDCSFAIGLRVGAVLKQWIKLYFSDFDAQLLRAVQEFLEDEMMETHREMAVHLLQAIEGSSGAIDWEVKPLKDLPVLNPKTLVENPFDTSAPVLQYTAQQFADQLTLRDRDIFVKLDLTTSKMKGLLGQAWTKPAQQHVSRSVGLLIARLNQCSYWVASVVLSPPTLSKRIKTLTKIIRMGDALRKMHNFMGVAYIIFGLSQASVSRLKFTLSGLSKSTKKTLAELQDLMDPTSSYKNYRAALAAAPPPVLPFVYEPLCATYALRHILTLSRGVKLSDLTMIEEGNPTFLPGEFEESPPLVNVQKQEMVYNVLSDLTMFKQSCEYNIAVQEPLFSYCKAMPHITDEDELYFLSRDREPPRCSASDLK